MITPASKSGACDLGARTAKTGARRAPRSEPFQFSATESPALVVAGGRMATPRIPDGAQADATRSRPVRIGRRDAARVLPDHFHRVVALRDGERRLRGNRD